MEALRYVWWSKDEGVNSREVWGQVNSALEDKDIGKQTISRASIINFLNRMVDEGILSYREKTGKGGHHRVYYPKIGIEDEKNFKKEMAQRILAKIAAELKGDG